MTSAQIIDGKKLAQAFRSTLRDTLQSKGYDRPPGLATVLVGDDPASAIYVANKRKSAAQVGIESHHFALDKDVSEEEVLAIVDKLNNDDNIDAILVQLPLPSQICERTIIEAIDCEKDVDGFHPNNLGRLLRGDNRVVACTPLGIMKMLESIDIDISGKHAVVVGRSNIVGKPIAHLLLQKNATVTICHSRTKDLAAVCRSADILVAAIGRAKFIGQDYIKPGAVVIDVGMNRDDNNKLCGDVDFVAAKELASFITPVPGGVGPMTIAMLLNNTYENFLRRHHGQH